MQSEKLLTNFSNSEKVLFYQNSDQLLCVKQMIQNARFTGHIDVVCAFKKKSLLAVRPRFSAFPWKEFCLAH